MRKKKLFTKGIALALCGLMAATSTPIPANAASITDNSETVIEQVSEEQVPDETQTVDTTEVTTEAADVANVTETTAEVAATNEADIDMDAVLNQVAESFADEEDISVINPDDAKKVDLYTIDITKTTDEELNNAYLTHTTDELIEWISTLSNKEIELLSKTNNVFTQEYQTTADICKEDGLVAGYYDSALEYFLKVSKCKHVNALTTYFGSEGHLTINTPSGSAVIKVSGFTKGDQPEIQVKPNTLGRGGLTWSSSNAGLISIQDACNKTLHQNTASSAGYTMVWAYLVYHKPAGYYTNSTIIQKVVDDKTLGFYSSANENAGVLTCANGTNFHTSYATAQDMAAYLIANVNNNMIKANGSTVTIQGGKTSYTAVVDGAASAHTWGDGFTLPGKTPITHTVSFNSGNGQSVSSITVQRNHYAYNSNTIPIGHDAQSYVANNGDTLYFAADYEGAKQVSLPAAPTATQYTISYDSNGGSAVGATHGSQVFQGWAYDANGELHGPGQVIDVGEDRSFTGRWSNPTVTLANAPLRQGYTFRGWNLGGSVKQAGERVELGGNATAKATWQANHYTVKYDLNGGVLADGGEIAPQDANYDLPFNITDKIPTKATVTETPDDPNIIKITKTYEFLGWATNAGATSPEFTKSQEVKNLTDVNGAEITLYAVYKEDKNIETKERPNQPVNPDTPTKEDIEKVSNEVKGLQDKITALTNVSEITQSETNQIKSMIQKLFGIDSNIASKLTDFIMSSNLNEDVKLRILNHLINGYLTEQDKQDLINAINSSALSQIDKESLLNTIKTFTSLTFEQQKQIIDALNAGSSADFVTGEGIVFVLTKNADGTISVALKDLKGIADLVIPNAITIAGNTYPVTAITPGAFKGNTVLRTVSIPSNVATIGDSAFENCKNLTTVKTDKGLVTIGNKAFKGCVSLTGFTCPSTVKTIGNSAFEGCTKLAKIFLNDGLLKIGNRAFYGCSKLTSIAIPKTVLKIGSYAIAKCKKLKKITFRNYADSQCVTIGNGVFSNNVSLTSIKLPKKITVIPTKAFYKDTALKDVSGMSGVVTIGTSAFEGCKKISKITLNSKVQEIKGKAFYNCKSLKTVKIKSKALTKVGSKAFKKCKKNITFTVPNSKVDAYNKLLNGKY